MTTVKITKSIDVNPQTVWRTISAGDGLDKWLPVITQCRLEGSGEGATRYCTMANGAQLTEKIVEVDHSHRRFRYTIDDHPLPARNLAGTVEIRDLGSDRSEVSWSADFDAEEPQRAALEGMFREVYSGAIDGLANFLKRI
jgi:uncharacterized protein YndB with AHSA1/START domain